MLKSLVALTLIGVLTGCSSGSAPMMVAIPGNVVSDSVVVPSALQAEYQGLLDNVGHNNLVTWDLLRNPATVQAEPLSLRRAFVYYLFDGASGHSYLALRTMPGNEGAYDSLAATLAQRFDFRVSHTYFNDWEGTEEHRTTDIDLQGNRAFSLGELAWIADWIITNYGDKIAFIDPYSDTDIVNPL